MIRLNNFLFFGTAGLIALLVAELNLYVEYSDIESDNIIQAAVEFQVASHGIINIPDSMYLSRSYKLELLRRESQSIKGVFVGSSTLMGLRPSAIHGALDWMNMEINANTLPWTIGEADAILEIVRDLRFVTISMDWGMGFPFDDKGVISLMRPVHPPVGKLLPDLLSLSRTKRSLAAISGSILSRYSSFFGNGKIVKCENEEIGLEYCDGFRYDGSTTFFDANRATHYASLQVKEAELLLDKRSLPESIYYKMLLQTNAKVPTRYYESLGKIAEILAGRGGRLALLMPPMLPGLSKILNEDLVVGPILQKFKAELNVWALDHKVDVIDLNESERFGCDFKDFGDGHHALSSCWDKITFISGSAAPFH